MISETFAANSVRLARVTHVYPEGQTMDVCFLDTGDFGRHVQLMTPYGGSDFGFTSGVPSPAAEGHDENMHNDPDKRTVTVVVANMQGKHIALGFMYPQVTQMAFSKDRDKNRMIERHPSGFYRTIDDEGNMDMRHPSGVFIRIGAGSAPTDLTGRDFDGRWKVEDSGSTPTVTIGGPNYSLTLAHGGAVTLTSQGALTVTAAGAVSVTAASASITAPTTITGDLAVTGAITATGDVTAGSISLQNHVNTGVVSGGSNSGPPA
ncbi:hypothetical protein [uncultured Thiodictyon sp.]|uniref:hypothetical protein n=1 Tax=uncultured Thiodictyon sp. TaxID=1846217 RepID=UPI0025DAE05D|nr:hypothetical protein [uncultured Thiodictyon sp.]